MMETYAIVLLAMLGALIVIPLLTYIVWAILHPKRRDTVPGYHPEITVKHDHELELYYQMFSSNSTKVRCALGEAGLIEGKDYIARHLNLHDPAEGKGWTFLKINPSGTVPVLIHNGHPIYHSHEQIKYILKNFCKPGVLDVESKFQAEMEASIDTTAMMVEEVTSNPIQAMEKRAGNCLFPMTIPMFLAGMIYGDMMTWGGFFKQVAWIPIVKELKFIGLFLMAKRYKAKTLEKAAPLNLLFEGVKVAIGKHMRELESQLQKHDGRFLFGDSLSMADLGWIPILDRMRNVGWLELFDKSSFEHVHKYWSELEQTEFYAEKEKREFHMLKSFLDPLEVFKKETGIFDGLSYK